MNRLYLQYDRKIKFITFSFLCINILILSKMFAIQTFQSEKYAQSAISNGSKLLAIKGERGKIFDRSNRVLAQTIPKYTFWVNTTKEYDKNYIIDIFSKNFGKQKKYYNDLLASNSIYTVIEKNLLESECSKILSEIKNIKGLYCDKVLRRHYPNDYIGSQVIGYVDRDHIGQFGIEKQFDSILKGKISKVRHDRSANGNLRKALDSDQPSIENGVDIQLTIDFDIQTILQDALLNGLERSGAQTANGIIIDPFTGDILAIGSAPFFNPNEYSQYSISTFKNDVVSHAYEPGSTFKIVAIAAALESGTISKDDIYYCENGKYRLTNDYTIHDHEPNGVLTLGDIFVYSSNIGLAKISEQIGSHAIYNFARKFGFGVRTGVFLPSELSGTLRNHSRWSGLSGPIVSIGQEVSVTTLQLAMAYSVIANGGYLTEPRIIKSIAGENYDDRNYSPKVIRRVVSKSTSDFILNMMENVVDYGTGDNAKIPGYRIGGKTGTAEIFIDGKYSKDKFISSFVSIFPINKPKYVCIISVDSPTYGLHWGNETAAPIAKNIFERIINLKNDIGPDYKKQNLYVNHQIKKNSIKNDFLVTSELVSENIHVPNFIGKTLKQAIKEAKMLDIKLKPVGLSGRIVWQSISPGMIINSKKTCTIKLETL